MNEAVGSETFALTSKSLRTNEGDKGWLPDAVNSALDTFKEQPLKSAAAVIGTVAVSCAGVAALRYRVPAAEKIANLVGSTADAAAPLDAKALHAEASRLIGVLENRKDAMDAVPELAKRLRFKPLMPSVIPDRTVVIPTFSVQGLNQGTRFPVAEFTLAPRKSLAAKVYLDARRSILPVFQGSSWGGTGFVVDESGIIATANHVVSDPKAQTWVRFRGENLPAKILVTDSRSDVALLKVDRGQNFPRALPVLHSASALNEGRGVYLIGYPHGARMSTLTKGRIQKLELTETPRGLPAQIDQATNTKLQTGRVWHTAETFGGNSGGPLLLDSGQVVAVHTTNRGDKLFASGTSVGHISPLLGFVKNRPASAPLLDVNTHLKYVSAGL